MSIFVILSIPTVIGNLVEFYGLGRSPLAIVSNNQIKALNYLKENTGKDVVILTVPFQKYLYTHYSKLPFPIYAWYPTAYVPALASRRTYLSSEEQLDIMNYKIEDRLKYAHKFFEEKPSSWHEKFLVQEKIDYIYIAKDELEENFEWKKLGLEKDFENNEVEIYRFIRPDS